MFKKLVPLLLLFFVCGLPAFAAGPDQLPVDSATAELKSEAVALSLPADSHIASLDLNQIILPGTFEYIQRAYRDALAANAAVFLINLNTPGGMVNKTQEIVQLFFASEIPVIVYVTPGGATATSAGVFITMAGHIAAMSPGTSIGAAHPVAGDGKNIQGDMRSKAENMVIALARSISEERGRNVEWSEKAVKESASITAEQAVKDNVVDLIAPNLPELFKGIAGLQIKLAEQEVILPDYSKLPVRLYEMSVNDRALNFISHPNIASLLWLGATTGLSIEMYNPGLIIPGVIGVICLVLALTVMQVIPITYTGMVFFLIGSAMIALEFFIPSGILAIGGIISFIIGAIYLVDPIAAPGLNVDLEFIIPLAIMLGAFAMFVARMVYKSQKSQPTTGAEGMVGKQATVFADFDLSAGAANSVFVNGEYWNAEFSDPLYAVALTKGTVVDVVGVKNIKTLFIQTKTLKTNTDI